MHPPSPAALEARLAAVEDLTRRYARYSRTAGGLATTLGGALAAGVSLCAGLATLAPWQRVLLAAAPLAWLLAKELLRRRLYQRRGTVREALTPFARRLHVGLTAAVAVIALAVVGFVGPRVLTHPTAGGAAYLAYVAALPVVAWFFLWTAEELIVGVFLFCQGAIVAAGGGVTLARGPLVVFVVAIVVGLVEHARFRRLERELEAAGAPA